MKQMELIQQALEPPNLEPLNPEHRTEGAAFYIDFLGVLP
jgi:hypothetical protein